jgi:hypothetical protein
MQTDLPAASSVLAVCADPDDESFGLGAVLATFRETGARLSVLTFTHGEASTLRGNDRDLAVVRKDELEAASAVLGVDRVELLEYPDGELAQVPHLNLESNFPEGNLTQDSRSRTSRRLAARRGMSQRQAPAATLWRSEREHSVRRHPPLCQLTQSC